MPSTPVHIEAVTKRFNAVTAVDNVDLSIREGEFFTLLGASGCGKTTLLRIIAGFLKQNAGSIRFGERRIDDVPAHRRNTGMVFQSYAIFPHLSVVDNIAYGLRARGLPREEIAVKVARMIEMTRLDGLGQRRPRELSGGQQQRVVLARAIVIEPEVLLMDEPLSNLDAAMRIHLRAEIRALQRAIGVTTIYVTHDQEEALLLSDRIAVMREGRIEQVGSPQEIYGKPRTRYVAGFIGESNFLPARRLGAGDSGTAIFEAPGGWRLTVPDDRANAASEQGVLAFRPHDVEFDDANSSAFGSCEAMLTDVQFTGSIARYILELSPGVTIQVTKPCHAHATLPVPGTRHRVCVPPGAIWAYRPDAG